MKVTYRGIAPEAGHVRVAADIAWDAGDAAELWFEVGESDAELLVPSADPFAILGTILASAAGESLVLDGPVSASLLLHLDEAARCLHTMGRRRSRFARYRAVEIEALQPEERDPGPADRAVIALSGGIDSTYSLWRHTRGLPRAARVRPERAVFVHGYDIPLTHGRDADAVAHRIRTIADLAGVPVVVVRSNLRLLPHEWEIIHGAAVAAALTAVSAGVGRAIVGSSAPYDRLVIPWGSAPFLDHLYGSRAIELVHDGASANRLDKVRALTTWPEVVPHLQVCWESAHRSQNCGHCRKCVSTYLLFHALGEPAPFLDAPPSDEVVEHVAATFDTNGFNPLHFGTAVAAARHRGLDEPWMALAARRAGWAQLSAALADRIEVDDG